MSWKSNEKFKVNKMMNFHTFLYRNIICTVASQAKKVVAHSSPIAMSLLGREWQSCHGTRLSQARRKHRHQRIFMDFFVELFESLNPNKHSYRHAPINTLSKQRRGQCNQNCLNFIHFYDFFWFSWVLLCLSHNDHVVPFH